MPPRKRRGTVYTRGGARLRGPTAESSRARGREEEAGHDAPRVRQRVGAEGENEGRGIEERLRQENNELRRELEELRKARQEAPQEELNAIRRALEELQKARQEQSQVPQPPPSVVPPPAPQEGVPDRPEQSAASVPAPVHAPPPVVQEGLPARHLMRGAIDEGGVSMGSFLKLGLPVFTGLEGEEPSEFLRQVEKVVRRLPCSDSRAIELVGLLLKERAWDWFQYKIEEQLYTSSPPTWEKFKLSMMEEFLTEGDRENKIAQFERLKQGNRTVSEYVKEFDRLSKYATNIVPTEAARINRFRRGLIAPLHNILIATEYTSFSKLVDKAKQMEAKYKEDREERGVRMKGRTDGFRRREGSRFAPAGVGTSSGSYSAPVMSSQRRGQFRGNVAPPMTSGVARSAPRMFDMPPCNQCGRRHGGECRLAMGVCMRCGQPGHYARSCPTWNTGAPSSSSAIPPASVQPTRSDHRSVGGRGRSQVQNQSFASPSAGRGQGRIFALNRQEAQASNATVEGIISVQAQLAKVLFDSGATHSFISPSFALRVGKGRLTNDTLKSSYTIGR